AVAAALVLSSVERIGLCLYTECDRPAETWDYVRYLDQEISAVSPLPREGRDVLYELYHAYAADPLQRAKSAEHCASGTAAIMLHSLAYLDRDKGEAAREVYLEAAEIVKTFPAGDWVVNLSWHAAAPMLLELEPPAEPDSCSFPDRPRFFVYETGEYAKPLLSCASGMEGSEVLLHRFLLRSACRTREPEEADYFYVPFYSFCYQNLHIAPGSETVELDRHNVALVKSLAHFDVYRSRQHIFHFAHEFWDFPSWDQHVARSVIFAVEANPLIDVVNYRHCTTCFDPWKDVVVPGHTDLWAMRRLQEQSKATAQERKYLFCFHGSLEHDLYERTHAGEPPFNESNAAGTRRKMRDLAGEPGASIGPHITPLIEYYRRVGDCRFCLVPKGVGYTNGRLFEAFFAGCIPVILSDAMQVPFQGFVPWREFSIKAPMADVAEAVQLLRQLPPSTAERMKSALEANACWFDYYSADPLCSPYEGVLRLLRTHRQNQQSPTKQIKQLPLFWAPDV
ncbi:unnamed protein product, partial [Polarella glacialis]